MNVSGIWQAITDVLKPTPKHPLATEKATDQAISSIAPERIRRSPGMQNLAEFNEEPDWYQDRD